MTAAGRIVGGFFTVVLISLFVACGAPVNPIAVTLSPSGSKAIDQAQTVSLTASVKNDAKAAGVTWSVSGGGTLGNQSTTGATYNTPASVTTAFTATVMATSATDTTKNQTLQITVNPLPAISTTTIAPAAAGSSYSATISMNGGSSPFKWSVSAGTLPLGLTLASSTTSSVTISGTPTGPGSSLVTIKVVDATGASSSQSLTITVNPPPTLTISTASLPAGILGTPYSQTASATGGVPSYKWAVTAGSLPAGLTMSTAGVISGTPTGTFTGTSNFTVTVTDSQTPTPTSRSASLSISVSAPPLSVITTSLPGGTMGTAYSQSVQATGGVTPYSWAVTSGSLPQGLTLNATTGLISGTPAGNFTGTSNFSVTATDAETPTAKTASANLSIAIAATPLSVTTSSLPGGVAQSKYAGATLQATGGVQPFSWAVTTGSLPAGLSLNGSTGAISGTPTASGTFNFTVTVTDSQTPTVKTATANLSIAVNPQLSITTMSLAAGVVGTVYNQTVAATGGISPYSWAITSGGLPAGLTMNGLTGAITGTPTGPQVGAINFTIRAVDSEGTPQVASASLSITISAPPLSVTTLSLPADTLGTPYSQTLTATGGVTPYTWSISAGALPAGLTLNANTGVISGTPTGSVTGAVNFTVKVTDSETPTAMTATAALSITISASPLSVVSTSLPGGVAQSVYVGATLQAAGGVSPYTWAVTNGSLPAGLTLNASTGAIAGTPTASGTATFTVTVTDSETPTAQTATKSLSITINPQLAITTASLATGVVGTAYSQTLAATGGITPYAWAVTTGSLPAGLTLNASTGAITGTPTGPLVGTISFTVTVTDSESPTKTASANLSISVSAPTLSVTTASLPGGMLGTPYSQTLTATGGITPYSWSVSAGGLPAGLTLNANTGVISGTPTGSVTGAINFTVKVKDSETPTAQAAMAALSITISASPLSVTTTSLPVGVVGSAYSATLQAAGGVSPYTWAVTNGSLPAGLSLNASTGTITGTPTNNGSNFEVTVTDSETPTPQTAKKTLSITVNPQLMVTTGGSLPNGTVGTPYTTTLQATGGITPYSWAITAGSLPPGLTLNSSTGAITGTPTGPQTGVFHFTVTVTDSESPTKTASAALLVQITAPTLTITTTSLPTGVINQSYNANLSATGGITPYTWSIIAGSLPVGLTLNPSTGAITGTPTVLGTSNFTVRVTDAETPIAQGANANLSISINNSAPLQVTTSGLPTGIINTAYPNNAFLSATGGVQPYTWSISAGSLPNGLTLNASTGQISGTPTAAGTFNFTAKVTDSSSPTPQTATANLSIIINSALAITTTSLPSGNVNSPYNVPVQANGGLQPYTWSISAGNLPTGLNLNSGSGQISGTPSATGTFSFTVTVTDSESPAVNASANLSITINNGTTLQIQNNGLPEGSTVTFYSATLQANGGVPPYTWSVSSGSLPTGLTLNSSTGVISGIPTATGTTNFTVRVTDSTSATATANRSIVVITCTNNSMLNGHYAAALEGWNTNSSAILTASAASFVADGAGHITSGIVDSNDSTNGPLNGTFTGAYCVASNNLGLMTLNEGAPYNTSNTFAIALNSSGSNGKVMFYDTTNTKAIGQLRKQDTTAFSTSKINGNYAFGLVGVDGGGANTRFAMAGEFNSNGAGTLSGMVDADSAGTTYPQVTLTASNFTVASNGRGTATITFVGQGTLNFVFYVVSATELFMMETDTSSNPLLVGHVLQQSSGGFTDASLNGNSILGLQGVSPNGGTPADNVTGGIITALGNGSASINLEQYDGTTLSPITGSGTYSVSANGRVTLSGFGNHPPVFYLVTKNEGFAVGTDNAAVFGQFYPQTGSSFNNASIKGMYTGGSDHPQDSNAGEENDSVTSDGAGNFSVVSDNNNNGGGPQQNSIAATYSVSSNGQVVVSQGGSQVGFIYIVNSSTVLFMPTQDSHPKMSWFQQ